MKNKLMQRPLMGGVINQRVDNEMLSLTDLTKVFEANKLKYGWLDKRIDDFFRVLTNKDRKHTENFKYICDILELQGVLTNTNMYEFINNAETKGLVKALKSIGQYKTSGRAENKAVFCNPYIFIAVGQWMNTRLRAHITIWATDQLILNRIDAGIHYNKLCDAINTYIIPTLESDNAKKFIFSNFARLVNRKVFGKHDDNLRQIASKEQLSELKNIETEISTLIKVKFIKTYQDAKDYLKYTS